MPSAGSDTVVMKFGGTSVADAERIKRAAQRIVAAKEAGTSVVAVLLGGGDPAGGALDPLGVSDGGAAELHHDGLVTGGRHGGQR